MVPVTIENPGVHAGDAGITFPVKMESGMYLEFRSASDCKLYGRKGEFLQDVPVRGSIPILVNGDNEISFTCDGPEDRSSRVQVTVISEGKALEKF